MRTLIVIALIQTGLLVAIFGKIVLSDEAPAGPRSPEPRGMPSPFAQETHSTFATDGALLVDEQLLRDIIRDEFATFSGSWAGNGQGAGSEPVYDPALAAERQARREQVEERIDYFSSVGYITDAEMRDLKSDIARLDPDSRVAIMQQLVRALNTGAIDGRL